MPSIEAVEHQNGRYYCRVVPNIDDTTNSEQALREIAHRLLQIIPGSQFHSTQRDHNKAVEAFKFSLPSTHQAVKELLRLFPTARHFFTETISRPVRIKDLKVKGGRIYFRLASGQDFEARLDELRAAFPRDKRNWDNKKRMWDVPDTQASREKLAQILPNAAGAFAELDNQLPLL